MFRISATASALVLAALALTSCTAQTPAPVVAADAPPDVGVELFALPWTSVAQECEQTVAPNGFAWVLTSPAQASAGGDQWSSTYEPDGYTIDSALGTRDEFADMVARCAAVGVDVIADAVIAEPAGDEAPGTATPTPTQNLDPAFTAFLDDLVSLGVAGVRVDASSGVTADQLRQVAAALPDGTVIMSDARDADAAAGEGEGDVVGLEFEPQYGQDLGAQVSLGVLRDPALTDPRPGHVPSASAVVFVDDATTERTDAPITYRDGELYVLANVLMLADDYGTPMVHSGYAFTSRTAGPPLDAQGRVEASSCAESTTPLTGLADGERTCTQAWTAIAGMLQWRSAVGDAPRTAASQGGDLYGFERTGRGVVAVNPGGIEGWVIVPTSMPDGDYCDVITGGADAAAGGECAGEMFDVNNGSVTFHLQAMTAAAIDLSTRIP